MGERVRRDYELLHLEPLVYLICATANVRNQQLTTYGSYDLPFGKGKQYASGVNRATDLLIGGFQLSSVSTWSGGLPFTAQLQRVRSQHRRRAEPGNQQRLRTERASGVACRRSLTSYRAERQGHRHPHFYQTQFRVP